MTPYSLFMLGVCCGVIIMGVACLLCIKIAMKQARRELNRMFDQKG